MVCCGGGTGQAVCHFREICRRKDEMLPLARIHARLMQMGMIVTAS
jgi:hypothetical protein